MPDDATAEFPVSKRNRVVRRGPRGRYDKATVYDILDAAMLCHVAYVIDGQPYCTPTSFWREGDVLYWHGSSASRMIREHGAGLPVCVTVTHMDAIVLARCGFNHSVNYRSVMAYGTAGLVTDEAEKLQAMDSFLDRFFPGRAALMRPATAQEIKATSFVRMEMEQASGKIRDTGIVDEEADFAVPAWTALLPIRTVFGAPVECERQHPEAKRPDAMRLYDEGQPADEAFRAAYRMHHGE